MADPVFAPLAEQTNLYLDAAQDRYVIGIPKYANLAGDTVGRFAQTSKADHIALIHENPDESVETYTFAELDDLASRFAVSLRELGVRRADPVAILTAQGPQTAIAQLAVYKLGAIALTISHLYGEDAVAHVINDAKPKVLIARSEYWSKLGSNCRSLPSLEHCILHGPRSSNEIGFQTCLETSSAGFEPVLTKSEDPAILMYTSGSTGKAKGILHAHRLLHAYRPGLTLVYNLELNYPNAVFWSPSDWAWIGGLFDVVLSAWQHGQTVVSCNHRFSAQWAFEFMQRHQITHSFMTPTALKRLAQVKEPRKIWGLAMRVVSTGGESLPAEVLRWAEQDFGVACNEFYGLSEFTDSIGCCKRLFPTVPGSIGRAFPGHTVAIIDEAGIEQPDGTIGEIAVWATGEPCLFLGYWGRPGIPEEIKIGNWLKSGDLALRDQDGYFWYKGRADDLINSSGYRIGPNEIEEALMCHPDVAEAAVVGKPDADRGEIVMAYVRLADGIAKDDQTRHRLQQFVKQQLAFYKYPRVIEFVDEFPMTSTGKIRRGELRKRTAGAN